MSSTWRLACIIFAVGPALKSEQWTSALLWGALFGLFAYGTYDLTNLATLRNWTLKVALLDMAWGTFVTAMAAAAGCAVAARLT